MIALGLGFHGYPATEGDDYPLPSFFVLEDYQYGGRGIPLQTLGNQETRFAIPLSWFDWAGSAYRACESKALILSAGRRRYVGTVFGSTGGTQSAERPPQPLLSFLDREPGQKALESVDLHGR